MTQILIDIDHDVMRVYQTEARKRGVASGQVLIAALIADWPAMLAPVQPAPTSIVSGDDNPPFGSSY